MPTLNIILKLIVPSFLQNKFSQNLVDLPTQEASISLCYFMELQLENMPRFKEVLFLFEDLLVLDSLMMIQEDKLNNLSEKAKTNIINVNLPNHKQHLLENFNDLN